MAGRGQIGALALLGALAAVPAAARLLAPEPALLPRCEKPVEILRDGRALLVCDGGAALGLATCDEGGAQVAPRSGDRITIADGRCLVRAMSAGKRLALGLKVDVNRASVADLASLPGIGPKLAERIVAERAAHGAFGSLEELTRVEGVGAQLLDNLAMVAYVGAAHAD